MSNINLHQATPVERAMGKSAVFGMGIIILSQPSGKGLDQQRLSAQSFDSVILIND